MMTIKETLKNKENPVVKVYPVCGRVEAVVYENNVETGEKVMFGTMTKAHAELTECGMVKTGEVSASWLFMPERQPERRSPYQDGSDIRQLNMEFLIKDPLLRQRVFFRC